jgi:hypothetical protein
MCILLKADIEEADGSAVFDFSGMSSQVYANLNATHSVSHSAVIYSCDIECFECDEQMQDDVPEISGTPQIEKTLALMNSAKETTTSPCRQAS